MRYPWRMSIDDELEREAGALEDGRRGSTPPVVGPSPRPKRNIGLLGGLVVVGAGLVGLVLFGFKEASVYSLPVDKALSQGASLVGRKLRLEGELVPGSLVKRDSPCEYRFTIHTGDATLPVRYAQCVIPDTFRDMPGGGVQVTVEGTLRSAQDFEATLVMAKCTSKYDPTTHEMAKPEGAPLPADGVIR